MSTISSIQNQPAVAETAYCGSCSQFLYDIVNKVKEVFLAILQTILPCFFSSATLDANTVTQLTSQAGTTPAQAVQQAGEQLAQQSVGAAGAATQPSSIPSGGQPVPPRRPAQREEQHTQPSAGPHSPAAQHGGSEEPGVEFAAGADGAADLEAHDADAEAESVGGNAVAGADGEEEWLLPPPVADPHGGGHDESFAAQELRLAAAAAAAAANASRRIELIFVPLPPVPASAANAMPALMGFSETGDGASATTPRRETLHAPAGGSLPHDDNDGSGAGSFAAALLPSAFAAAVSPSSVTVMKPLTPEFPGSNPSNPSDTTDVSDASSDALSRAVLLTRRLEALRSGRISASQVTDPTDVDDGKEADDFKSQVHQTQRAVIIQQGSGEEPAGFFAACAMATDWKRDFNEVIPESSEFDETLTQAKTEFNKHREGNLVEIAQNGGMQFDNLGLHRSRHAWVDTLRTIAVMRQQPIVAILTNDAYSMSYAVRIAKQGSEYVCHLFSPNADWNPAEDESDPIYQSFTKLDDLKGALPRAVKKYSAYELTGVAKYQHSHGTGSSDEFAAVAAAASLPASGVLVEAAPNPDEQS